MTLRAEPAPMLPVPGALVAEVDGRTQSTRAPSRLALARSRLRSRLGHVLLFGFAATAITFLRAWPQLPESAPTFARVLPEMALVAFTGSLLLVAGVSLAQVAPVRGWRSVALAVAAALCAVTLLITLEGAFTLATPYNYAVQSGMISSLADHLMYLGWEWSAIGVGLALTYAAHDHEAGLAAEARAVEIDRLELQRSMMESRLAVLRARVEPEFLFGALDEVQALYRSDRIAADAMIDALIVYLRAALPQMRGEGSTIGREIDLARAYVAVLQAPRGDALAIEARADVDVCEAMLPPMVLLPLTQAAFAGDHAGLRRRYVIAATGDAKGFAITVEVEGGTRPDAWRGAGPETASRTLKAYFGTAARLEFATEGARHRAEIRLPPPARPLAHAP